MQNFSIDDWESLIEQINIIENRIRINSTRMIIYVHRNELHEAKVLRKKNILLKQDLQKLKQKLWRVEEHFIGGV